MIFNINFPRILRNLSTVLLVPSNGTLRRDYTTSFGNFILYYKFVTNSLKFIKV